MRKKLFSVLALTTLSVGSAQALTIDTFSANQVVYDGIGGVDVTEGGTLDTVSLFVMLGDFPTDIALTVSDGTNTASLMQTPRSAL